MQRVLGTGCVEDAASPAQTPASPLHPPFLPLTGIQQLFICDTLQPRNEPGWSMILLPLVEEQLRNLSLWQSVSKHLLRKRNLVTMTKSTAPPVKPIKWSQRSYKYGDFPQSSSYILNGFKTSTLDGSNLTRLLTSPLLSLIQRVTWQLFLQPL